MDFFQRTNRDNLLVSGSQQVKHSATLPIFRRQVSKNCALLGCYAANSGDSLPTFRALTIEMGAIIHPETSVKNYHYLLCNSPEERRSEVMHSLRETLNLCHFSILGKERGHILKA